MLHALKKSKPREKKYLVVISASLILLGLSTYMALNNMHIGGIELVLINYIYGWPEQLTWLFILITQLGTVWLAFGVVIGLIIKHRYRLGLRVLTTAAGAYALVFVVKRAIERARPHELFAEISSRELLISDFGFPSGHTAMATAISLSLLPVVPSKYRWLLIVWPLLVGLSRIYLGVHAPLDIIGGFSIGLICAFAVHMVRRFPVPLAR